MDEPLSNLDAKLRHDMRVEIRNLQQRLGMTVVYVTHDQTEAMSMADKVILMRDGRIEQEGNPEDLYDRPATTFVAGFIGSPKMNLLSGAEAASRGAHTIGIRPEHLSISDTGGDWPGIVGVSEHLGSDTFFHIQCDAFPDPLTVRADGGLELEYGAKVHLTPDSAHLHRFGEDGLRLA